MNNRISKSQLYWYDSDRKVFKSFDKEVENLDLFIPKVELYWYDEDENAYKPLITDGKMPITQDVIDSIIEGIGEGGIGIDNRVDGLIEKIDNIEKNRVSSVPNEGETTIVVSTQEDCNNLLNLMRSVSNSTINVVFRGGKYFLNQLVIGSEFNNKTINFYNVSGEEVEIFPRSDIYTPVDAIESTPTHYICAIKSEYLGNNTLVSDKGRIKICDSRNITNGTLYRNAQQNLEQVDAQNYIYRMKLPSELEYLEGIDTETFKSVFVWSAYLMFPNKILEVEDGYIYFKNYHYTFPNLDRTYLGMANRFYLTNQEEYLTHNTFLVKDDKIYIPKDCKYAISARSNTCFDIQNTSAQISFTGLNFSGGYNDYYDVLQPIININASNISITRCNFHNVECQSIYIKSNGNGSTTPYSTKNIKVNDCSFENTGNGCVDFIGENISVTNSKFKNIGEFRKGSEAVFGAGKNFYVAKNHIHNFPYVGIRVGKTKNSAEHNSGIFEKNILHNDTNFKTKDEYMADGGAIYVFTYNVDVTVRDNIIYNLIGHDIRGIMGDDGNNNTKYIRNLIFNMYGTAKGIDCLNPQPNGLANHANNLFKNNIVVGTSIAFTSLSNSNTQTEENLITHEPIHRNGNAVIVKKDYHLNYYRTDDDCLYLDKNITLPFELPEIFDDYLKFEDPVIMGENRGNVPILLNNTLNEINGNNVLAPNIFILHKYDMMNLNMQMIRGFTNSPLGLYNSLNMQVPWDIGNKIGECFINFKVNLFSERATYRNSFEVTLTSYKPDASTYQNFLFEVSNVTPKVNSKDVQLKVVGYVDELGYLNLLLEPLVSGNDFFNSNLSFIEVTDVKVTKNNSIVPNKGVVSVNKTIPQDARILGTYGVLSGRALSSHLKVSGVSYPENTTVFLTDTNQIAIRKNSRWYVQTVTELT